MNINPPVKPLLAYASICFILFFMALYDTTHAHVMTYAFNEWFLQHFYMPPITSDMSFLQKFYYEALIGLTALGSDINFLLIVSAIFADLILQKKIKPMLYGLLVAIIGISVVYLLKEVVSSQRPMFPLEFNSFPSGHVTRTTIWCGLFILYAQMRVFNLSKFWYFILLLIPFVVAYSRMALGYHWFSDVMASLAVTTGIFFLVYAYLASRPTRLI